MRELHLVVKHEIIFTRTMWNRVKKGVDLGMTKDDMLSLAPAEVNRRIEEHERGKRLFLEATKVLSMALLRHIPPTACGKDGVIIQVSAKPRNL